MTPRHKYLAAFMPMHLAGLLGVVLAWLGAALVSSAHWLDKRYPYTK
jgi:hypothetical protein